MYITSNKNISELHFLIIVYITPTIFYVRQQLVDRVYLLNIRLYDAAKATFSCFVVTFASGNFVDGACGRG